MKRPFRLPMQPLLCLAMLIMFGPQATAREVPSYIFESNVRIVPGGAPGMKVHRLGEANGTTSYLIVFAPGDEISSGLRDFARTYRVTSGSVSAVGAFRQALVGWYDIGKHRLRAKMLPEMEVVSLTGNFAMLDGAPFTHLHVSGAMADGSVRGGHLVRAWVGPGLEVTVTATPGRVERVLDPKAHAYAPKFGPE